MMNEDYRVTVVVSGELPLRFMTRTERQVQMWVRKHP